MILKHSDWPTLRAYWDEYGHVIPFDKLDGIKTARGAAYVVVRWTEDDGSVGIADLVCVDGEWDMCNDGFDPLTEKEWTKMRLDKHCDTFTTD